MTVADLKHDLTSNEEFPPIVACFLNLMEGLARDPDRMAMGEPISDSELHGIFRKVVAGAFPGHETFDLQLFELKANGLVHGQGTLGGMCFAVMFFREIDTGLVAVITDPRSAMMAYVRFRLTRLPSGVYEILSSSDPNMN
jgi:hypothetical protein